MVQGQIRTGWTGDNWGSESKIGGGFQQESQTSTTTISPPARKHSSDHYNFCNSQNWASLPVSGFSAAAIFQHRK